ncbi:MAG: glutamate--tRNA ligase, partial [Dehalococcoidia bacterium]
YVARIVPLVQERIKRLDEAVALTAFFFVEGPLEYPGELLLGKRPDGRPYGRFAGKPEEAAQALATAIKRVEGVDDWRHDALEGVLRPLAEELGLKAGDLFMLIRVAVTGQTATPPLFETMEVLGRERSLARLRDALARLE